MLWGGGGGGGGGDSEKMKHGDEPHRDYHSPTQWVKCPQCSGGPVSVGINYTETITVGEVPTAYPVHLHQCSMHGL